VLLVGDRWSPPNDLGKILRRRAKGNDKSRQAREGGRASGS
jgi:hypothetical protein